MRATPRAMAAALLLAIGQAACVCAQAAGSFPAASPESQGMSSAALEELATIVAGYLDREYMLGAELLVIKNRHAVLHRAYGWRDREEGRPMELNSIFNVRSMTKPFTGAAAHLLIEEGSLRLDDAVAEFLPGFANPESGAITIEQLLTHRSGLPLSILTSVNDYPDLAAMGNAIGERGPQFPPGSKFWYSDAGTDALGAVVEQLSGMPLGQFVTGRLLAPLEMNDSFSQAPAAGREALWDRVPSLYLNNTGPWVKYWQPDGSPFYPFTWGSQSLYATPMDYAQFLAMWMDAGRHGSVSVLPAESVQHMLTPASPMTNLGQDTPFLTGFFDTTVYYGQMSVLYLPSASAPGDAPPTVIGHSGSDGTWAWAWPDLDLMVLYFTQSRGGLSGIRLEMELDRLLVRPTYEPPVSADHRPYLGTYLANFGTFHNEEFRIFVHNGHLTLDIPSVLFFELQGPGPRGRWQILADPSVSLYFTRDAQQRVTAMRWVDPGGTYNLPRVTGSTFHGWWLR